MMLLDSDGKAGVVRRYARRFPEARAFMETGTGYGELVERLASEFETVITVEKDPERFDAARKRLEGHDVTVYHGDSGSIIGLLLPEGPTVFWLDAHDDWVGGSSALRREMAEIGRREPADVILIDDARLCTGQKGWMEIPELVDWAEFNGRRFELIDDIVRITP